MSIELNNVASGYSTGVINTNFQKVEEYINDNLLNRDGLSPGQANQMNNHLDMNGFSILNLGTEGEDGVLTVDVADERYVNVTGDSMTGPLNVLSATQPSHAVRKEQLDAEVAARQAAIQQVTSGYQEGDANLQAQISGGVPLEASAFSPISWHKQEIENSVTIPENMNAWSFGPTMTIAEGQAVTISENSFWTIANGEGVTLSLSYDGGTL